MKELTLSELESALKSVAVHQNPFAFDTIGVNGRDWFEHKKTLDEIVDAGKPSDPTTLFSGIRIDVRDCMPASKAVLIGRGNLVGIMDLNTGETYTIKNPFNLYPAHPLSFEP
jgi:hypothetical protein